MQRPGADPPPTASCGEGQIDLIAECRHGLIGDDPASDPGGLEGAPRYLGSTTLTVLLWFEMT